MKYCTEEMLNFWTLGFYGRCCKRRINYNRWLDRHLVWKGGTPAGYNDQFRIFDDKLTCPQKFKMGPSQRVWRPSLVHPDPRRVLADRSNRPVVPVQA